METIPNLMGDSINPQPATDGEGSKKTILQLPYEIFLAIFHELSDWRSIKALACAHPTLAVVLRENRKPIQKAMRYKFIAEIAKRATGYESPCLSRLILSRCVAVLEKRVDFKVIADRFSDSWVVSGRDMRWAKKYYPQWHMPDYYKLTGELEFFGFFAGAPDLDLWYDEKLCPKLREVRETIGRWSRNAIYGSPSNLIHIEVVVLIDVFGFLWGTFDEVSSSPSVFLDLLSPELVLAAKQFARCYLRVIASGDPELLETFEFRIGPQFFVSVERMTALLGASPTESHDES
ncbi:hypothetical protein F4823DRAFT_637836 [Ustulina deusta]|nr:hypothetical protein F4823DRAFT_637836 [Ustulina deusta]